MKGKLHVYTGNGKGKTTAAMGLALRSLGHGRRVLIAQFLKDGRSGELAALRTFERATVYPAKPISGFVFAMTAAQKEEAAKQQNAQAAGFYARLGFRVTGRDATDPSGRPYPILHLSLGETPQRIVPIPNLQTDRVDVDFEPEPTGDEGK